MMRATRSVSIPAALTHRSSVCYNKGEKSRGRGMKVGSAYACGCGRTEMEVDLMTVYYVHVGNCKNK